MQAGANGNYYSAIEQWPMAVRLDQRPYRLQSGVRYRFRVELDGRRVGLWIDGKRVVEAELDLPIATGYLGFYAYYPDKAFGRVRIYQKRLPQVTSVLALGELYLRDHAPERAAATFREVAESQPGTDLAVEARYRQGLALREAGNMPAALAAWAALPPGEYARRVEAHRLDQVFADGREVEACAAFLAIYRRSPELRSQLRRQWQMWARDAIQQNTHERDPAAVETLVVAKLSLFPEHIGSDGQCAELLNRLQRFVETAERFPQEVLPAGHALTAIGRAQDSLQRFADSPPTVFAARHALGRFADVLADPRTKDRQIPGLLCQMGRAAELAAADPPEPVGLLWIGEPERALAASRHPAARAAALAALGRWQEAVAEPDSPMGDAIAMLSGRRSPLDGGANPLRPRLDWRLIRLAASGEEALTKQLLAAEEHLWPNWDAWIRRILVVPLVRGDAVLLRERLELAWREGGSVAAQRPRYLAGVVLGRLPHEALDAAPCAGESALWRAVAAAMTAELAGDKAAASQAWRAYCELPWHRRLTMGSALGSLPDPALEALAQWRAGFL